MLVRFFAHVLHAKFLAATALLLLVLMVVSTRPCFATTSALLLCGSHGTSDEEEPERQCMKVRPLNDRVLTSHYVPTCAQIDPPSLNLDSGPASDTDTDTTTATAEEEGTFDNDGARDLRGHRELPKKPKEIVVVGSNKFVVEMDVNNETAVWWHHIQEQDDGCDSKNSTSEESQGRPESLRLEQVEFLVFEGDFSCEDYWAAVVSRTPIPEIGDEVLYDVGQKVHVLLHQVLIEQVDLNLAAGGHGLTQTVSLTMKTMRLYIQGGENELVQVWQRNGIGH